MKNQALALVFANGINFLVNFLMNPFLARQLTYEDNATYGQINLINGYATTLFAFGLATVINVLLVEFKKNEKTLLSNIFAFQVFSGLICVSVLFLFRSNISALFANAELGYYLMQNLPSTFIMILIYLVNYYYIYFKKTVQLSILTVVINVIKIGLVFYAVNVLESLYYVIVLINLVNIIQLFVHFIILRKHLFPFEFPRIKQIKYVLSLAYPYLGMSLIGYSILYAYGIVVSNQLGPVQYAIYRNGALEIPFFATMCATITSVALPQIVMLTKEKRIDELLKLKRKISNTVAFLIYPVVFFFIFNGETFMELYLGNKYIQSGIIFSIYNLAVLIRINSYSDILTAAKKPMKIIGPNLISFGVGLILTIILLPALGIKSAAIAFVFSILVLSLSLVYNSCKEIGIKIKDYFDFGYLLKLTFVCAVASFVSYFFTQPTIVSFLLTGAVYLVIVYLVLIKIVQFEMDLLPSKVQNIIKRLRL